MKVHGQGRVPWNVRLPPSQAKLKDGGSVLGIYLTYGRWVLHVITWFPRKVFVDVWRCCCSSFACPITKLAPLEPKSHCKTSFRGGVAGIAGQSLPVILTYTNSHMSAHQAQEVHFHSTVSDAFPHRRANLQTLQIWSKLDHSGRFESKIVAS